MRIVTRRVSLAVALLACAWLAVPAEGQFRQSVGAPNALEAGGPRESKEAAPKSQTGQGAGEPAPPRGPAAELYRRLHSAGLDPNGIYHIRDAFLEREDIHIALDDGVIGFMQAVDGHITGALFIGEGDLLLVPPDQAERTSLALFTGMAVMEEKFTSAFFRFNDDTFEQLKGSLRPEENAADFYSRWDGAVRSLANADALRLLLSYMNKPNPLPPGGDRLLRARLQGPRMGTFDVFFDTLATEQVAVGSLASKDGISYYDVLTSFPMRSVRKAHVYDNYQSPATMDIIGFKIKAQLQPPETLSADAEVTMDVKDDGERLLLFELSRYLKVKQVEYNGKPLEFLQNEALEGTALARRGNDLVGVVFPEPLKAGTRVVLKFSYAGQVMSEAGGGLFYVGARGAWYPNRGLKKANFDLEFQYPAPWTLVATGHRASEQTGGAMQTSHWVSDRPLPVAGFNLGRYQRAETKTAGGVTVEAFAAGVESEFTNKNTEAVLIPPPAGVPSPIKSQPISAPPPLPRPASNAEMVAQTSARAVDFFSQRFGPYPFSSLAISQIPGRNSQSWPGLVFLSSYAFLSDRELEVAKVSPFQLILFRDFMQVHETAHQWWGDLVGWKSYRDEWIIEALANYSAVMALQKDRPTEMNSVLEYYRRELAATNADGEETAQAGPVTLGVRLSSSHFPDGFNLISYGRGTWLFHMLRYMLRNAHSLEKPNADPDELFCRGLRRLREQYAGKDVSTRELQAVFEEELPPALRYENRKSLDWFFESWVNGNALPQFELKDVKLIKHGEGLSASGKIVEKDAPQDLVTSLPIYASSANKLVLVGQVFADGEETTFRLSAPTGTKKLVIDPYHTVLTKP